MPDTSINSGLPVPNEEITVIIHGPILSEVAPLAPYGMTKAAVESVKQILPGAKIVISTWKNYSADHLDADEVVYSDDPGGLPYGPNNRLNNVNRQIVAMIAGLQKIKTNWSLKLRSDTILTSDSMIRHWVVFTARSPLIRVFNQRIVTSAILSYDPRPTFNRKLFHPYLFHVNDMIQFGLTSDMKTLWCLPLMPHEDFTYFKKENLVDSVDYISNRRVPEDYIWTTVLKSNNVPVNQSWLDFHPNFLTVSELSIVNNFILLDHSQMGFKCLKYPNFEFSHPLGIPFFTHASWLNYYQFYCDPSLKPRKFKGFTCQLSWGKLIYHWFNPVKWYFGIKRQTRPLRYQLKNLLRK